MYLIRLVYASTVVSAGNEDIVKDIIQVAVENNAKKNITGILTVNGKYFLQALEGSRSEVNALFTKICKDERHNNIIIIEYTEIYERIFSDWSMKYIPILPAYKNIIIKYSALSEFTPYNLSGKSATLLLTELKQFADKAKT